MWQTVSLPVEFSASLTLLRIFDESHSDLSSSMRSTQEQMTADSDAGSSEPARLETDVEHISMN
jgi:hypothetical protein